MSFFLPRPRGWIVNLILFLNVVVFVLWFLSFDSAADLRYMEQNFLVSWSGLEEGRYWTLLSSAFSHNMFLHIFLNLYVLSSFGPIVEGSLGSFRFLRFYLLAAIASSLCHAWVSAYWLGRPELPALGASGAVAGVILLFSLLYPSEKILLLGIIPLPAVIGALIFVGLDVWGLMAQASGGGLPIGHGAHLGGALTGLLYYIFIARSRIRKWG